MLGSVKNAVSLVLLGLEELRVTWVMVDVGRGLDKSRISAGIACRL